MPLPKGLTRFNRSVANKITRPFAARLPGFAVLHHVGRVSGDSYLTPMMAWKDEDVITVSLPYGSDVDWLKNAQASESVIKKGGRNYLVGHPEPIPAEVGRARVPAAVRVALDALDAADFVEFRVL